MLADAMFTTIPNNNIKQNLRIKTRLKIATTKVAKDSKNAKEITEKNLKILQKIAKSEDFIQPRFFIFQAAGAAAVLAIEQNVSVADVHMPTLQQRLME